MLARKITSVGIDVGTTTSQVIFSELELANSAAPSEVPRYDFSRRDVIYVSLVVFTPRDSAGQIGAQDLLAFIKAQYQAAGLSIGDVESGAIIITGEASKAHNARATVMGLAEQLGDFVVATAGPHLESVIAGHGSGAADYSRRHAARVLNIDIGGGTANYAVFSAGKLRDTACLNVGGHLIELDAQGQASRVHEPARKVLQSCFASVPAQLNTDQIAVAVNRMADLIVELVQGDVSDLAAALLMTPPLREHAPFDAVFISGGVGACFYQASQAPHESFGDIGPQLAAALRNNAVLKNMNVLEPANTLRATVIGAGVHTLSLSGSTIWLESAKLPIRNIPVLHSDFAADPDAQSLAQGWKANARMHDISIEHDSYALAIPNVFPVNYRSVLLCASAVQEFMQSCPANPNPLIVIARQDFGKALGMELQPFVTDRDLAVIDEVQTREWDYIDIGKSMFDNTVVPLTVKSLAFPS